ncbi:MAG: hypothetical protein MJ128_03670 [Mogibacterium sp.]|nr:hypothetical protein [Mogibacterium sp.]
MTRVILRAKRISIIRSIGYKWRFRELESESTTQKRKEVENLRGRLKILRDLDKMYAAEVTDEAILIEKQIKALKVDLKIYSHACIDMDPQEVEVYMQEMGSYIRESISDKAMQRLNLVDRAMYEAMLQGDQDRFIRLADFSKNRTKECLNIEKNGIVYKKVPSELFGTDLLDNTISTSVRIPRLGVLDVECDKGRIRFKSQLYFGKMDIASPEDQQIEAFLCDEHTGEETALAVTHFDNDRLTSKKGIAKDRYTGETAKYNYDGTGFYIDLYPEKIGKVHNAVIVLKYRNRYTEGIILLRNTSEEAQAKIESHKMRHSGYMCRISVAELKTVKVSIEKSWRYYF